MQLALGIQKREVVSEGYAGSSPPSTHGKREPTRLYFIRHGRSIHNESNELRPLIWDAPLHKIGIRQAACLRQQLKQVPLEVVVTSPMTRAIQTALIALGDWSRLEAGGTAWCENQRSNVENVTPNVEVDESGARFDATVDEVEPLEGKCLGPGSRVRLRKNIDLGNGKLQESGSTCTVMNASVKLSGVTETKNCMETLPTTEPRCPVLAWPEACEQLHESDDLGSPAPELRQRFPCVDFARLPQDNSTWWWKDADLPATFDALTARACWEQHGRRGRRSKQHRYDEPDENLDKRVVKLLEDLDDLSKKHKHVALFAHQWVLEEIWRQRIGKPRRFANAEMAVVEVYENGRWEWLRETDDSSDSDSSESSDARSPIVRTPGGIIDRTPGRTPGRTPAPTASLSFFT